MKFGCCVNMLAKQGNEVGVELIEDIWESGFDYVELSLANIAALAEDDYQFLRQRLKQSGIKSEACNNFFPSSIKLTGPEVDMSKIMAYVNPAMERAARLDVKIIVFGSGLAKMVPVGFSRASAQQQLVELLTRISVPAKDLGLTVAIEPLRRQECNIINSAADGLTLARAVNTAQVKLLIDFYHLKAEGESCQIIKEACDQICHVHLAKPDGRRFPALADLAIYQEFFDSLASVEYQERISIEAYSQDYRNDAANSLSFLRNFFIHDGEKVLDS